MNQVWDKIEDLALLFINKFSLSGDNISSANEQGWQNYIFQSSKYRRAHVEIVDFRNTHKIYILHTTVFAYYNDPSPIFGFDAICGPGKITGAFHDFSAGGDSNHPMMKWFQENTLRYNWQKPRNLPEWARNIFSESMVAAGNIREEHELNNLYTIATESLDYYLKNVGQTQDLGDFHMAQNRYCFYQKQNPQVVNSMVAMGIEESKIRRFVDEVLFPESESVSWI